MKKLILIFTFLVSVLVVRAQAPVEFYFSDGVDGSIKTTMEQQMSKLLTAINTAANTGGEINYSGINIDNLASQSIGMSWNNAHFRTCDNYIVEHCVRLQRSSGALRGFEVRNIMVNMIPVQAGYESEPVREICVSFDPEGRIVDFNFGMESTTYQRLLKEGVRLDDLDRRMQIIQWCEQFRMAYNNKDMDFMNKIFSDDALIITGKVIKTRSSEISMSDQSKVVYVKQKKTEYLNNLGRVFRNNNYINVKFDEYEIKRHGAKPNFYLVTLHQLWHSSSYRDEGMVVLVWDFTNEDAPVIQVRTWQPMGEKVFNFSDIKLP